MAFAGLCAEARALSAAARERREEEAGAEREAHAAAVARAQALMQERLLGGLEARVLAAATEGRREAELMSFEGGEAFEDTGFVCLYLLKGPRQPEPGVRPLLPALRNAVAPFTLRHVWRPGTTRNSVVVSWAAAEAAGAKE